MTQEGPSTERLDSWKEIAAYVGRDVRTVIRWEQKGGLPVYRIPVGQRQAVYAFRHEIDEWMAGGSPGRFELAAALEVAAARPEWNHVAVTVPSTAAAPPLGVRLPARLLADIGITLAGLFVLSAAAVITIRAFGPVRISLDRETQITNDEVVKENLVTDGVSLYFSERRAGRDVLSSVPAKGGPVTEIPTTFIEATPQGVSPDRQTLLILAGEGEEKERPLWVFPLHGNSPWRVGDIVCHAAAWSPDGTTIAYALGNGVYITADKGVTSHLIHTFTAVPLLLRWSFDGKRILIRLRDSSTWNSSLSELVLSALEPPDAKSLDVTGFAASDYNDVAIFDRQDDAFVLSAKKMWLLSRKRLPWQSGFTLGPLTTVVAGQNSAALDPATHMMYVARDMTGRDELDRFDRRSHQFRPFLPGISVRDVDFSIDGRSITYVREPENTLWVGTPDGKLARQIATPNFVSVELPRWSPDGKRIAFMGKRSDAPYRIFIVAAAGGSLKEASRGSDNQGAPTWSPDGRYLVYGRVLCQEERTCEIERIDLNTAEQAAIPGSEGLSTARWSPNGRSIAALRSDRHQVVVMDVKTGKWKTAADGVNGNDLAWSPDSRALYASRPNGDQPEVVQISPESGRVVSAVDLTDFSKLSGRIDTWFTVAPDNSVLFLRVVTANEIWALNYSER